MDKKSIGGRPGGVGNRRVAQFRSRRSRCMCGRGGRHRRTPPRKHPRTYPHRRAPALALVVRRGAEGDAPGPFRHRLAARNARGVALVCHRQHRHRTRSLRHEEAGIVQHFHALASLPSLDGVVVLLNSDEEIGSPTSRALIEEQARQVDAVLVLEAAADGAVKTARKGMSLYCVDIEGRAAHAGLEPERGVNAVVELAHQIQAVVELADPAAGTSVVPSVISGGTTTNTVAAQAQLWCDVRMWSAKEQERIDRSIRALTPALAESRISVSGGPNRGPLESVSSEKLYFLAHQVSSESGLGMLRDCAVGGASDGNFTAAVGTPTLDGLGAVGGGAHAATEHVEIDQMIPRATLLAGLVTRILEGGTVTMTSPNNVQRKTGSTIRRCYRLHGCGKQSAKPSRPPCLHV